ncbi:MAG: hypothetical protein KGJ57_11715 [Sphingomonadales bacterium]|nr:hypothetical protein [Sphingomonadales bacterium]MDE2170082.1 hypothetical protein [Sphingomonadales bacterium]
MAYSTQPRAQRAPLAGHPLFGPLVMLWFAALFGLSVLAIEGATLEHWVLAMKIDEILPAAAPPLGVKARLLAAVAMGVVGAGLGWVVARVMRPAPIADGEEFQLRQRDRHPDAPARRPISAHAELGDEGLGRASSAWDDAAPHRAEPKNYEPQADAPRARDDVAAQPSILPLATAVPSAEPEANVAAAADAQATQGDNLDLHDLDLHDQPTIDVGALDAQDDSFDEGWHALPPVVSDSDLPPAIGARLTIPSILPKIGAVPLRAVEPALPATPEVETPALIGATPVHPRASAGERINQASLSELSHVELIERLAMAIHSRDKKSVPPVAVNDLLDAVLPAEEERDHGERPAPQASLRSALANLREVK